MSASALADAILVVHAAFVLFVVGGLAAIWIGIFACKRFAYSVWFRGAHLAAIAFVTLESLLGFMCPLTIWEDALRGRGEGPGFIQRWIHAWLYWDLPGWVFAPAYLAFALLVIWTWVRHPPRRYD
ncbi:MAG: DUF2784 domain-containing protein [Burkholderiales bacterium]|nr:DUF2784 domain-containing protein [Burkholderiales bacterium]